jgi:hypothetical protein
MKYAETIFTKYGDQVREHVVEIRVDDTSGKYFFPDDAILRTQKIVGLSIIAPAFDFDGATYFVQNSPETDRPLIIPDAFFNAFLYLLDGSNTELITALPFTQFMIQPEDRHVQSLYVRGFTPSKSYVRIAAPATVGRITEGQSIILSFWYLGATQGTSL